MGIVNATPDSFSDGGQYLDSAELKQRLEMWCQEGVDILDVGAESTRPGASEVSVEEQLRRLRVVWNMCRSANKSISIDTRHARVAEWAVENGAACINDVSGGTFDPEILQVAAKYDVPFVVMHSQGLPASMQDNPVYEDVVSEVSEELQRRVQVARQAGVRNIVVDPGIGFGKTTAHNILLLRGLKELKSNLNLPTLVGFSRKRMFTEMLGEMPNEKRDVATALLHALIFEHADIVRVHNVRNIAMLRSLHNSLTTM